MIVLIILAFYGVSFLLLGLLQIIIANSYDDPDTFFDSISDVAYYWSMAPIVSPFIFIWMIHKALTEISN